jgi:oligopeptide/dipeptide ABC transporter ATP-binding protein
MNTPILEVEDLRVTVGDDDDARMPVAGVSFRVDAGEIIGVVGESGCGKSLTALAVAGLLPTGLNATSKALRFKGQELSTMSSADRAKLLGSGQSMVFQDPQSSLNPAMRVGRQIDEALRHHTRVSRKQARALGIEQLARVRIPGPERRAREFPYQFSGGMRQRVMIAMGLMMGPDLLIADEPTTALDVTVQADVVRLLKQINEEEGIAIVLVSHNIALLKQICTRILVMYAGEIVEDLPVDQLGSEARHPYTRALMGSIPSLADDPDQPLQVISGSIPDVGARMPGCLFRTRCPIAEDECAQHIDVVKISDDHSAKCRRVDEIVTVREVTRNA